MKTTVFGLVCGLVCTSAALAGANPNYDPQWLTGDHWKVRYSVLTQDPVMSLPRPPPTWRQFEYTYTVVSEGTEIDPRDASLHRVVKILAQGEPGAAADWQLTFDRDEVVLRSVEKVISEDDAMKQANPFTNDAWMAKLYEYSLTIVHDFPHLPDLDQNETRTVIPPLTGTEPFVQAVDFAGDRVTATLSRTDPGSETQHKTTIVWKKNQKWWSSAKVELNGATQVSGELVP